MASNWSGMCDLAPHRVRVRSGTLLRDLHRHLRASGRALRDNPQFDELSVGGAVVCGAHGFGAQAWFPEAVRAVEVARRGTGAVERLGRGERIPAGALLLHVELEVVPDRPTVVRRTRRFDAAAWATASHRMALLSGRGVLMTTVTEEVRDAALRREWPLSTRWRNLAFLCTGGCAAPPRRRASLSYTVVATLWPVETIAMRALGYRNAEVFVRGVDVVRLVEPIVAFHRRRGGHTELRQRRGTVAIDVALRAPLDEYWKLLHALGVRQVRLHPGKYRPETLAPPHHRRVSLLSQKPLKGGASASSLMDAGLSRSDDPFWPSTSRTSSTSCAYGPDKLQYAC